jgi:uncharacterized protein YyaL (SSP411 family)
MTQSHKPNRLSSEKSPYLLQHAHNPVDWYPWGEEAFARARREDKPIFLSIGYSTCHWCHVMEHESFENDDTAELLNDGFVAVKVDREERPDVDRIYMGALQAMGIPGGWPLSLFLTPELKPFYGGTYFPPENRYERAGFPEILRRIQTIWQHKRTDVLESGERILAYLRELAGAAGTQSVQAASMVDLCYDQIRRTFDERYGGFGGAPKFPRPVTLAFLLRHHKREPQAAGEEMALRTLRAMANGGIRDHLGGGFHRYSVDAEWRVPHFEKMLYDQAQLVRAYLDAAQCTQDMFFGEIAGEIIDYVLRDMQLPEGGFATAEDADSPRPENPEEHGEGAFYVWTRKEAMQHLGSDGALFSFAYGMEEDGNVVHDPQHEFTGRNILYRAQSTEEVARFAGVDVDEARLQLASTRRRLFELRNGRPRPLRDDKVITAWNGLMIGALACGSRVLANVGYRRAAEQAAEFIFHSMYNAETGELLRRYRGGEAHHEAHLEDYACFAEGLMDLFEATGHPLWLQRSIDLTKTQLSLFWDAERGGFYDTSGRDASILVRTKEQYDGAEPAGNSTAAMNLLRLSALTGNHEFRDKAEATVKAFSPWLEKQPSIMPYLAAVAMHLLHPPSQVVIVGKRGEVSTEALWKESDRRFLPGTARIPIDPDEQAHLAKIIPYAGQVSPAVKRATAYVCSDFVCRLPVTDPRQLGALLDEVS